MASKSSDTSTPLIYGVRRANTRPKTAPERELGKVIRLRPSQQTAWECLRTWDHGILNAPAGWGKSMVLCALAADDLLSDPRRKVVFAIPQTIISKGFINEVRIALPGVGTADWSVSHDLCQPILGKLDYLRQWLGAPTPESLNRRVLVTTHRNLALTTSSMSRRQLKILFQDTTLFVDEAHHIQASDEGFNQLGTTVNALLQFDDPSTRMILATAFFFRGDRLPIIHANHLARFCKHTVPFDEYWNSLQHLHSYRYDFVTFRGTIWREVETLLAHSQEPTLFFCPPEGHRLLVGRSKALFVGRLTRLVKKHYKNSVLWKPDLSADAQRVILDLVDAEYRQEKVAFAIEHGDRLCAIMTVGMFREGADWLHAQRAIDLIPTGSDQDRNQRFGRLVRDCPGKRSVSYFSFFQHVLDSPREEQRRTLSKLFAHFHASLVLENALAPIKVVPDEGPHRQHTLHRGRPVDLLGEYDEQTQESIVRDCSERLVLLAAETEKNGKAVTPDDAKRAITSVLDEYGIVENQGALARQIVLLLRRHQTFDLPVEDLMAAGFDRVWQADALEGLRLYSGGVGGPTTFREIRDAIRTVIEERWFEMYEKLKDLPFSPPRQSHTYWWISNTRKYKAQGVLSEQRIALLEAIPWWRWSDPLADRWVRYYEELRRLEQPPTRRGNRRAFRIADNQRSLYLQGKLTNEQIEFLETIPWWSWSGARDDGWQREYERLKAAGGKTTYKDKWAHNQKVLYRAGRMLEHRIELLESLPHWTWGRTWTRQWMNRFEEVKAFGQAPQRRSEDALYTWAKKQRTDYAKGNLSDEQIRLLESLPWWSWNSQKEDRWWERYYAIRNLASRPRSGTPDYLWMRNQLHLYQRGRLEIHRQDWLDAIPWWNWDIVVDTPND